VLFMLNNSPIEHIYNIGSGKDLTINKLARMVQEIVEHKGLISWDFSKPDGTPRKLMDITKITSLGWSPTINLEHGIARVYKDFQNS